jgi:hypothetical protein
MMGTDPNLTIALIALQVFVVLFIAFHDWIPLGRLNDIRSVQSADSTAKLFIVTVLSTLPFAVCLAGSIYYVGRHFPGWLIWTFWISYAAALVGMLRAWWVPYLLVANRARAARYQVMFSRTHAFLPARNGIRPNTLHVTLHIVIIAIVAIILTMSLTHGGPMEMSA